MAAVYIALLTIYLVSLVLTLVHFSSSGRVINTKRRAGLRKTDSKVSLQKT